MHDALTTVLTERGQTSVPAEVRRRVGLKPGQQLSWQVVSDTELRVTLPPPGDVPGPLAVLGYARKFSPDDNRSTDEIMQELRDGEDT